MVLVEVEVVEEYNEAVAELPKTLAPFFSTLSL
jgi:hypothetical protein